MANFVGPAFSDNVDMAHVVNLLMFYQVDPQIYQADVFLLTTIYSFPYTSFIIYKPYTANKKFKIICSYVDYTISIKSKTRYFGNQMS